MIFASDMGEHVRLSMGEPREIGEWKKISELGSGGFGVVTLWRHQLTEETVAIKKCKFQKACMIPARQKERWKSEVEFIKSCNHDNLVKFRILPPDFVNVLQKYNPTKLPLMSMEYCTKGNLRRFLMLEPIKLCGLPEADVRCVLKDISCGLSYLHSKNITHRDLKPENIVLQHCDNRESHIVYKIIDLGYAKELEYTIQSQVGTMHYLAPEIFENKPYNHTVDYWSMGLLVFEIICGVLPFLPEMTPFERFQKIREKGPEDICIYMQFSGAIASSAQLKKENFISTCLKEYLETWLRCVLQYNSTKRYFTNSLGVFEYLDFLLDKKIIQVFSVCKLEFFSYEINECTRLGTLREWISRDIKMPKTDFFILFDSEEEVFFKDDNHLIFEYATEKKNVFVIKKGALFDKIELNPPKAVKHLLFSSGETFPPKFERNLYRQCLFFVHSQKVSVDMLKQCFILIPKYLKITYNNLKINQESACEKVADLLKNIQQFNEDRKSTCDLGLSQSTQAKDCLNNLKQLLASCQRNFDKVKDFLVQMEALRLLREEILDRNDVQDGLDACSIDKEFCKINSKNFLEPKNGELDIVKKLAQVISHTIRLKDKHIIKNQMIRDWFKDFCVMIDSTEQLDSWAEEFILKIDELSAVFTNVKQTFEKILQDTTENRLTETMIDSTVLLKETEDLRFQFDSALSQSVRAHKSFTDDFDSFF